MAVVAIAAALLIGVFATVTILRHGQEVELRVNSYQTTKDLKILEAQVDVHPDFVIVRAEADEEEGQVTLHISARQPTLWWSGTDYAEPRWVRVKLEQPLGGRQVLDAVTGESVPRN